MSVVAILLKYLKEIWFIVFELFIWLPNILNIFRRLCINVITAGRIPHHIAIIMDGNRRYAVKANMEKGEAHKIGSDKLTQTIDWCRQLGIQELTVYAFSIDNFKRSKDEVDILMNLLRQKFKEILEKPEKTQADGVCIRIIGNIVLLPEDLGKLASKVMIMTKYHKNFFLNLALSYSSKDELTTGAAAVVHGVNLNLIDPIDITPQLISDCLATNHSPNPGILVRTSGEVRFSDFLLWQMGTTNIYFVECLWPSFSIWNLLACVFSYQRCYIYPTEYQIEKLQQNTRVKEFLKYLREIRSAQIEKFAEM